MILKNNNNFFFLNSIHILLWLEYLPWPYVEQMMSTAKVRLSLLKQFNGWSLYNVFVQISDHLGTNTIEHVPKKELYIILSTLENNLRRNQKVF